MSVSTMQGRTTHFRATKLAKSRVDKGVRAVLLDKSKVLRSTKCQLNCQSVVNESAANSTKKHLTGVEEGNARQRRGKLVGRNG